MISQCKIKIFSWLEERALKNKTYKLWIHYLVKPVLLNMAEREEGLLLYVHYEKTMTLLSCCRISELCKTGSGVLESI